jgi:hydroxymethylpyrimidine pyrophosphatase-like HAD family hydrolase
MNEFIREVESISSKSIEILKNIKELPPYPVIVFNIDNTLLDKKREPLIPVLNMYYYILSLNINIIIVTTRPATDKCMENTNNELLSYNIDNFKCIYYRKEDRSNLKRYKINSLKNIVKRGYNIIMNIDNMDYTEDEYENEFGIHVKIPIMKL